MRIVLRYATLRFTASMGPGATTIQAKGHTRFPRSPGCGGMPTSSGLGGGIEPGHGRRQRNKTQGSLPCLHSKRSVPESKPRAASCSATFPHQRLVFGPPLQYSAHHCNITSAGDEVS
jgi:hypothetical protein